MKFYYPSKPTRISIDSDVFNSCNNNSNYILQIKKNGWRVQIHKDGSHVEFFTRHNKRLEPIVDEANWELLTKQVIDNIQADSIILDGEFLHRRGERKNTIYIWDIFEFDKKIFKRSYGERKSTLNSIVQQTDNIFVSKDYPAGSFLEIWDDLSNPEENEGIVLKDLRESLLVSYKKPSKNLSPRQFKILLDDKRNVA